MQEFADNGSVSIPDEIINAIRSVCLSASVSQQSVFETIQSVFQEFDYVLDPHTAVACSAWRSLSPQLDPSVATVIVGTAHPAKFVETVERAIGQPFVLPKRLQDILSLPTRSIDFPRDLNWTTELRRLIVEKSREKGN